MTLWVPSEVTTDTLNMWICTTILKHLCGQCSSMTVSTLTQHKTRLSQFTSKQLANLQFTLLRISHIIMRIPSQTLQANHYTLVFKTCRISRHIRRNFFPEKCDLNSTCILCAEGKYYFQTYKYPYIYYTTSLSWDSENNHKDGFSGSDDDFLGFYDE